MADNDLPLQPPSSAPAGAWGPGMTVRPDPTLASGDTSSSPLPEAALSSQELSASRTTARYPTIAQSRTLSRAQFGVQETENAGADMTTSQAPSSGTPGAIPGRE